MSTASMAAVPAQPAQDIGLLYRDHHLWLRSWLLRRLGCSEHAADVAHDTFMRLLGARAALPLLREPRAYLRTTAQRLLVDRARHDAIERAWLAEMQALAEQDQAYPSPEEALDALRTLQTLARVLDAVAPRARAAFLLHHLDGLTHEAVAAQLGVSDRMVRKYLAQVLVQVAVEAA